MEKQLSGRGGGFGFGGFNTFCFWLFIAVIMQLPEVFFFLVGGRGGFKEVRNARRLAVTFELVIISRDLHG